MTLTDANLVIQIVAIALGGAWAIYTFLNQERQKRGLVRIDFKMRKVGNAEAGSKDLTIAVVRVEALFHNPGHMRTYLGPMVLVVHGRKVQAPNEGDTWKNHELALTDHSKIAVRDYTLGPSEPVFLQLIASDGFLEPNETISRQLDFFISKKKYNFLEGMVMVPYTSKPLKGGTLKWTDVTKENMGFCLRLDAFNMDKSEMSKSENLKFRRHLIHAQAKTSIAIIDGVEG